MSDPAAFLATDRALALWVSIPGNDPELARAAFEAGADGIKVHLNVEHRASGLAFGSWSEERAAVEEILAAASGGVGVMPGAEVVPTRAEMEEMAASGIAFFDAYLHHTPAWMLELDLPWMAAIGPGWGEPEIAALEELGMACLEASIVDPGSYGQGLTAEDLVRYRRIASATRRPVMVPSQKEILPHDLAPLRRAGVAAVLLGTISLGPSAATIRERLPRYVEALGELG